MNYLAHLHIAAFTKTSLIGNFLGDFVKGSDFTGMEADVKVGIQLHRKVDSFTDRHQIVQALKASFPDEIRRMAGVCIDIWFDYLLLQHNDKFAPSIKESILNSFYQQLTEYHIASQRYSKVKTSLLQHRWLMDYQHQQTCLQAFYSIEARLKKRVLFAEDAYAFLLRNQHSIEQQFLTFYPDLLQFSLSCVTRSGLPDQLAKVSATK